MYYSISFLRTLICLFFIFYSTTIYLQNPGDFNELLDALLNDSSQLFTIMIRKMPSFSQTFPLKWSLTLSMDWNLIIINQLV